MSLLERWIEYIANQTSPLAPLTVPLPQLYKTIDLASLRSILSSPRTLLTSSQVFFSPLSSTPSIARLVDHITTTPVHTVYYPFLRFGALHATRVCLVWSSLTRGDRRQVGRLQDLFGYLTSAWGGGVILSCLISQPPPWLISPTPWLIYPPIYFLLIPTGMASYITSTAPTFVNLVGAYFDGIARGITITSIPSVLASSPGFSSQGIWTTALLSGIMTCGGGWIVQLFNLNAPQWSLGVPTILSGSGPFILDSLEFWAAMLTSVVYCALLRLYSSSSPVSDVLEQLLPQDLLNTSEKGTGALVQPDIARAIAILLLGSLYCAKVITKLVLDSRTTKRRVAAKSAREKREKESDEWMAMDVMDQPKGGKAKTGEVVKATGRDGAGQVKNRKKKGKDLKA